MSRAGSLGGLLVAICFISACERPSAPPPPQVAPRAMAVAEPIPVPAPKPEPPPPPAPVPSPPELPRFQKRVLLKVKTETWREKERPFDIGAAVREKLAFVGVQALEKGAHDAVLEIDYEEKEGKEYKDVLDPDRKESATEMICSITLSDDKDLYVNVFLLANPELFVTGKSLYDVSLEKLRSQEGYRYLEHFVAASLGLRAACPKVVEALLWEESRENASRILKQLAYSPVRPEEAAILALAAGDIAKAIAFGPDAVGPLLLLWEKDPRDAPSDVLEALERIGDPRAEGPVLDRLRLGPGFEPDPTMDPIPLIRALASFGGTPAVQALAHVERHSDEEIAKAARESLKRIRSRLARTPK